MLLGKCLCLELGNGVLINVLLIKKKECIVPEVDFEAQSAKIITKDSSLALESLERQSKWRNSVFWAPVKMARFSEDREVEVHNIHVLYMSQ